MIVIWFMLGFVIGAVALYRYLIWAGGTSAAEMLRQHPYVEPRS